MPANSSLNTTVITTQQSRTSKDISHQLFLLDFDGCFDELVDFIIPSCSLEKESIEIMKNYIRQLWDDSVACSDSTQYACGSMRQDAYLELLNTITNGSPCLIATPNIPLVMIFCNVLSATQHKNPCFDPHLLYDSFYNHQSGTELHNIQSKCHLFKPMLTKRKYELIYRNRHLPKYRTKIDTYFRQAQQILHRLKEEWEREQKTYTIIRGQKYPVTYQNDDSKLLLITINAIRIARKSNGKMSVVHLLDDKLSILNSLQNYLKKHSAVLSENITIKLHRFRSYLNPNDIGYAELVATIKGTGKNIEDVCIWQLCQHINRLFPTRNHQSIHLIKQLSQLSTSDTLESIINYCRMHPIVWQHNAWIRAGTLQEKTITKNRLFSSVKLYKQKHNHRYQERDFRTDAGLEKACKAILYQLH